jgi:uncharacterized protein YbjT (DUF2867 family)
VYLGATEPQGPPSEHLRSRLEVGRVLRAGGVLALELRAAMIVGNGSASWRIVRDLAARLPAMVLPRWLRTRSQPVAIDDVIALATGARLPLTRSASFDLPGPEILSYREVLVRTARLFGHRRLQVVDVPVLSPTLSSQWIRLITMADWAVARELVLGLTQRPSRRHFLNRFSTRRPFARCECKSIVVRASGVDGGHCSMDPDKARKPRSCRSSGLVTVAAISKRGWCASEVNLT